MRDNENGCKWKSMERFFVVIIVQSQSHVQLFVTWWTAARQASLSFTLSQSLLKLKSMSWWCHPTISYSVTPFSSYPQSFRASGSFPVSRFFRKTEKETVGTENTVFWMWIPTTWKETPMAPPFQEESKPSVPGTLQLLPPAWKCVPEVLLISAEAICIQF